MLAQFKHKSDVQKWLDIIRGGYAAKAVEQLKTGTRPPFPYSDVRLLIGICFLRRSSRRENWFLLSD